MDAKELINIICPKHCRTSCSDLNICNGIYSGITRARCLRCTLLSIERDGFAPDSLELVGLFQINKYRRIKKDE